MKIFQRILGLLVVAALAACGDGPSATAPEDGSVRDPGIEGPPSDPGGQATVSFSRDVVPLFERGNCTTSGCHGRPYQSDLQLRADSAYVMLLNVVAVMEPNQVRVIPGDAQGSYLVKKLEGRHTIGARMPALYDPRPQSEIDVIRTWIDEGARNN